MEPPEKKRKLESSHDSSEPCTWSVLPALVLVAVLSLLKSRDDRRNVRLVCRHWGMCMNDWRLWKKSRLYITASCLRIPEWALLGTRQIRNLSFSVLPPCKLVPILDKLWCVLPQLRTLSIRLQRKRRRKYTLLPLLKLKCLEELSIAGEAVSVTVPKIAALKTLKICGRIVACTWPSRRYWNLQCLEYKYGSIFHQKEKYLDRTIDLHSFPKLTRLSIIHTNLTRDAHRIFSSFVGYPLKCLNLSCCTIRTQDLRYLLSNLPSLSVLCLDGIKSEDGMGVALDIMSCKLRTLILSHCKLEPRLHLYGFCYSDAAVSLQHLCLAHCTGAHQHQLLEMRKYLPKLAGIDVTGWNLLHFTWKELNKRKIQIRW